MKTKYKVVMSACSDRINDDGSLTNCPETWSYRVARNGRHQIVRKENEE